MHVPTPNEMLVNSDQNIERETTKDEREPEILSGVEDEQNLKPLAKTQGLQTTQSTTVTFGSTDERTSSPFRRRRSSSTSSASPAPSYRSWHTIWQKWWAKNRGVVLVTLSQLFGALMNMSTRLLETDGEGMHPIQILFARMSITMVLCCLYMWYTKVPDFPFGKSEVRLLLIARGVGGFFGVFGLYSSLLYLPIAEATVITFLAPSLACFACSVLIREPFTRIEKIAGLVSLLGVGFIARPTSFLPGASGAQNDIAGSGSGDVLPSTNTTIPSKVPLDTYQSTPEQRLAAVGMAMVGVGGAACAYTTIRWIGKRAHPLVSVNYFATWCTLVSIVSLIFVPSVSFKLPSTVRQWLYLSFLGVCGFIMQFLLTAGLAHESSSRATNMVYTQMLFALALDKMVFGTTPGVLSIFGSSLILGSAIYVAVQRASTKKEGTASGAVDAATPDEERGFMEGDQDGGESIHSDHPR